MIEFKLLSVIAAFVTLTLCVVLGFFPEIIFTLFDIDQSSSAFFIGRRAAMLFLGISVICWVEKGAGHSDSRQAICLGLSVSMLALAFLGAAEYLREAAGIGILLAVVAEAMLALLYFKIWFRHRLS